MSNENQVDSQTDENKVDQKAKAETKEKETISMPKEDYNEILSAAKMYKKGYESLKEEVEALKNRDSVTSGIPNVVKKVTERIVTLRVYDNKVVLGYVNKSNMPDGRRFVYQEQDPTNPKEKLDYIDLLLDGVDDPVKVQYLDFLNTTDKIACKVLAEQREEKSISTGVTEKVEFSGDTKKATGIIVPLTVEWIERVFTLKLPENFGGKEVKVKDLFVNA